MEIYKTNKNVEKYTKKSSQKFAWQFWAVLGHDSRRENAKNEEDQKKFAGNCKLQTQVDSYKLNSV